MNRDARKPGEPGELAVITESEMRKAPGIAPGMVIAVVDSGVDAARLNGAAVLPGVNFSGESDELNDEKGHGTQVAAEILRIAPQAVIVPVKVTDKRGALDQPATLERAFAWVCERRAALQIELICVALADFSHQRSDEQWRGSRLQQEIAALREAGTLTIAAAGNWRSIFRRYNPQGMAWPAILREVISVGELRREADGLRLSRSTQRLHASLGTGCHTTIFAESGEMGETSGAAAVACGCLAALRQSHPEMPVEALLRTLLSSGQSVADSEGLDWPALNGEQAFAWS